jgi:hypothetical protein
MFGKESYSQTKCGKLVCTSSFTLYNLETRFDTSTSPHLQPGYNHHVRPEFQPDWNSIWCVVPINRICGDDMHLGHPSVTVACQSDSALFTLGLNLAKSTSLGHAVRRKVANHSPWTPRGKQTSSKDIWSGGFPFLSNTFTHLHQGHFRYACTWGIGLLPDRVLK